MGFGIFRFVTALLALIFFVRPDEIFAAEEAPKNANAVLSKAAQLVDLQIPSGPPFLLMAKVVLREGQKSVEGVYAVAWAGPGQYRRVFRFPSFTATEVVTDGVIHRQRSTEALPLMIWELDELLSLASRFRLEPQSKVLRVQTEQSDSKHLTCVLAQSDLTDTKLCVDEATGEPFSFDRGADVSGLPWMREHFEFADFHPFEGRTFPRRLSLHGWGSRVVEVQVQSLTRVQSFAPGEFTPPKGATRTHFCEEPQTTGEVRPSTKNVIPIGLKDIEVDMYFQVSPIGAVRYAQVLYSSSPIQNSEILNWYVGTHFPIKTCAGNPVAYETVIRLVTGH